jgi:hypothetical protein
LKMHQQGWWRRLWVLEEGIEAELNEEKAAQRFVRVKTVSLEGKNVSRDQREQLLAGLWRDERWDRGYLVSSTSLWALREARREIWCIHKEESVSKDLKGEQRLEIDLSAG